MSNQLSLGDVLDGKVTAIKEYGAFVSLSNGVSGLVHISQIASEYVKQVGDYLTVGDEVKVKVIDLTNGKVSLSIKAVSPLARKDGQKPANTANRKQDSEKNQGQRFSKRPSEKDKMNSLEEKLKKWMKSSEERIQELQSKQKRK